MAKYKRYNYNQTAMVPINLESQITEGTFEWVIHEFMEQGLNTSLFDERFKNDETGRTAYDPKILLKIILFGYSRGIHSSRELERACKEHIIFMALACGQTPDHTTIAKFVSSMQKEIILIFRDVLLLCDKHDLLGGTAFAIDGCKISSNASKEMSGTFEQLGKKKKRLEKQLRKMVYEHQVNDKSQNTPNLKKKNERKFRDLTREIEKINRFLEENEPREGKKKKEIQSNTTDNDSSLMKTSKGTIQGYNAQILVDSKHQVILHADPGTGGYDHEHVPPLFDGAKENLAEIKSNIDLTKALALFDSAYYSHENLEKCLNERLDVYIPDNGFRQKDPSFNRSHPVFTIVDFEYDPVDDNYTCPAGKKLKRTTDIKRNGEKRCRSYRATTEDCMNCGFKKQCLKHKNSTRRYLNVIYDRELSDFALAMHKKMLTPTGKQQYDQRIGIIEPVFANICIHKKFDRFLLRGKEKVNIQWMLCCIVHNLEKVLHYGGNIAFNPV
jgi:transposase